MDALQKELVARAESYLASLEAEAQSLKRSLDEARAKLEAVQEALAENGTEQAHERQRIAELKAGALENPA